MSLDTSGALLEGVRVSTGNAGFTYPPRNMVVDYGVFSSVTARAEYIVQAFHPTAYGTDLGDPQLWFYWSRNEGTVSRFDFDNFGRRWSTSPGGPPDFIGVFGNAPRLKAALPDASVSSAPYEVFLGSPVRSITLTATVVGTSAEFTNPIPGTVQVSRDKGELNFSSIDLSNPSFQGLTVFQNRQSYFDRMKTKGAIGVLPDSVTGAVELFMNPKPGSGQFPRIRIGFREYLEPVQVSDDSSFSSPSTGTFQWSAATGKMKFSYADLASGLSQKVYYDGTFVGRFQLSVTDLGLAAAAFPFPASSSSSLVGLSDPDRFAFFSNAGGVRNYFQVSIYDSSVGPHPDSPPDGTVLVDRASGNVFLSVDDVLAFGSSISFVDCQFPVDKGVAIQFRRSGVNTSGLSIEPDVTVRYKVDKQILTDNIPQSPFVMLPIIPVVDSSVLLSVDAGPGATGTFTGDLVDGNDPSKPGVGYEFDLENKKLVFCLRKSSSIILDRPQSQIKLADPMVFKGGFQASRNGLSIVPGVDFDFDPTTGLLEFIQPVGENDPGNVLDVAGTFGTDTFFSDGSYFLSSHVGRTLFVQAGPNSGVYRIAAVLNSHTVRVSGSFPSQSAGVVDVRMESEIVADRFWQDFIPPLNKFSMVRTNPLIGQLIFGPLDCTVLQSTAQVNLAEPAKPGDVFNVTYISLESPDDGITVVPTPRTEKAGFKVRQETAVTVVGSNVVFINPNGKPVDTQRPMKVYIDGVTQEEGTYSFAAPGSITVKAPVTTEQIVVDYWINEAIGGETNFNLLHAPVDVDYPQIVAGKTSGTYNGDQTSDVVPGGAFLIDGKEVVVIRSVSYDAPSDTTTAVFEETPVISTDPNSKLQVTQPISGSDYRIVETSPAEPFVKNANTLIVAGNQPYVAGMVVTVNEDPYIVGAVKYNVKTNKTSVMTVSPAKYNYIVPRITRTVRPVLQPGGSFQTSEPAHMGYPFHLVLGGTQHKVLQKGLDYQVGEGGAMTLSDHLVSGDVLYAIYVGRVPQPAGTVFNLNYAYGIAPDDKNGMKGQRISASYNLFAPDTFFFRIETVPSFIPEVIQELKKSSSGGSSGPNTGSAGGLKTKDFGSPGLYYDEQHLGNLDFVLARLLKFYNDFINLYEDLLADLDGRVVGGPSGRFRFDGNLSNPPRPDYSNVTNDIDDRVLLYFGVTLTGFFTFSNAPMYGYLWQSNNFSRFFPTLKRVTSALNGNTGASNFGKVLGSLGVSNVTSTSLITSTRAASKFASDPTGRILTIPSNGDPKTMLPAFAAGQKVDLWTPDGQHDISSTISSTASAGTGFALIISDPTTLVTGGVTTNTSDPTIPANHFYAPGRDVAVNNDNGQISNATVALPAPFDHIQVQVSGNELVDATVTFQNADTAPLRIPALDGLPQTDSGGASVPPLFFSENETDLLSQELAALNGLTTASLAADKVTLTVNQSGVGVGDTVKFLNGGNGGHTSAVTAFVSAGLGATTVTVSAFPNMDTSTRSVAITKSHTSSLDSILARQLAVLETNVSAPPSGGFIGKVRNETSTVTNILTSLGRTLASGTGSLSSTLSDGSADFESTGVVPGSYVLILSGRSTGAYKVISATPTFITVDPAAPFPYPGSVSYTVIQPWGFIGAKEFAFPNAFIQKVFSWYLATSAWSGAYDVSGVVARQGAIAQRQIEVAAAIKQITGLLGKDDKLYDSRYLWISSRIDRKTGTLFRQSQAASKRLDATKKLLEDQQKLLITSKLM